VSGTASHRTGSAPALPAPPRLRDAAMTVLNRVRNWRNPHNQTRIHLAGLMRRYGFEIGEHTYGHPRVRFPETGRQLRIGRFCSIADRVEILLGGNHRTDWATTYPFTALPGLWPAAAGCRDFHASRGDVTIGHDVWLGSGAMVLSGVTIGHGAIVGARAVVSRDVPPYAIVAGHPARLVRHRFDPATVALLLETAWWDVPRPALDRLIPLLQSARFDELARAVAAIRADEGGPELPSGDTPRPAAPTS